MPPRLADNAGFDGTFDKIYYWRQPQDRGWSSAQSAKRLNAGAGPPGHYMDPVLAEPIRRGCIEGWSDYHGPGCARSRETAATSLRRLDGRFRETA